MSEAERPPVVLLHGALGSKAQMARLAGALEPRLAPFAFDFLGHGASVLTGPLTMERLVDQLADAVRAHGLGPVRLFGYSMGGYVALQLAATHPELVHSVATLATKLLWTPEVAARLAGMADEQAIAAKLPKFAAALQLEHTGTGWERLCRETREMFTTLGDRPLLADTSLAGVAQPVRLMLGDRDDTVTLAETVNAFAVLPKGELEVLPGTGHPFPRVDVERLAFSLGRFFAS